MSNKGRLVKELTVPLVVVAILASILLPVPPSLLDFLLGANLALALLLLVSTLYIVDPIKLSSLPALLLLATLFRLALNISTTRNILSHGEAGEVIEAFGSLVVQDSLIVGTVIFLIITLVQFIVIAKGAERVAEVSARFTLDALPGKQMSIDADVRAGLIEFSSARTKRQDLQTESRFYGALDGAMKFIKGDAIAGMVIVAINVVGGIVVGVGVEGLSILEAISHYTRLTIGDGLVAQIPALLNSLAAGIVVTRVAREDQSSLSLELLSQLGQIRIVKFLIAGLALVLGAAPGMPILPFASLAVLFLVSGLCDRQASGDQEELPHVFTPKPPPLLKLELGRELAARIGTEAEVKRMIEQVREDAFARLGLILPVPELSVAHNVDTSRYSDVSRSSTLPAGSAYRVWVRGIGLEPKPTQQGGADLRAEIREYLYDTVRRRAVDLTDDVMTRRLLDSIEAFAPDLVSATVPTVATATQITDLLKNLLREEVPITNFDLILQAVAEHGGRAPSERALLESVREQLKWVIASKFWDGKQPIRCTMVEPIADLAICQAERERRVVDLTLIDRICAVLSSHVELQTIPLVVGKGARRLLAEYLYLRGFRVPVIAREEVPEEVSLEVVREIAVLEGEKSQIIQHLAA